MTQTDPTYPLYPVFAFIGFVIVLIPLPWHFQAWNSGTCLFMIWTALGCLNLFINSIVWHNNVHDWSPVWCDISSHIVIAVSVGIPASSLCINRRLYNIATCQTVSMTKALKRRAVMVDLAIALGLPLLQLPLQFIVQGHRYDILEDIGCYPTTYNTIPAYPLIFLWPNVMNRRAQFSEFLSSNTALTANRYFRLMALATVELAINTPISSYGLYLNITQSPIQPWISWANTHFDFGTIDVLPALLWRASPQNVVTIELSRWAQVFCAFARKHYRIAFWAVATRCGLPRPADGALPAGSAARPVSLPRTPVKRRPDSLSPSLADTSTDYDADTEKGDYILPTPSSGSAPPEYMHDIELGAYSPSRPSPTRFARPSTWPSLPSPTAP
ncbi:pheromone A receptor-domain-containing protein [Mycena rosella]|uniref:Pheromone A receptor-domain-containing protein n=1 Tax=Mycena rosella TaxID=1033263 RepID=A0AAD7CSL3_MYCRO|nr:pheromone A receptor-domain-containing protein [Mycena rosella]